MSAPRNGRKIRKIDQPALPNPDRSCRRKTSARIVIRNQIQMTHAKKMNIDHMTSRNGKSLATIGQSPFVRFAAPGSAASLAILSAGGARASSLPDERDDPPLGPDVASR